ncbi:MAG: M3 family oligoendopeptidase [Bacillales bacterium]|jgi:pepF/M3 family oligoendopeptidase|nr:M3 family oligoendopeptidase [Bacillales bacterium]
MQTNWNLNDLYEGFKGKYENDLLKLKETVNQYKVSVNQKSLDSITYIENVLKIEEQITILATKLISYPQLIQSTNVNNEDCPKYISKVITILNELTASQVDFSKYLVKVDLSNLDSELINEYRFILNKRQENAKHLLSKKEEIMYAKLSELASSSWDELQSLTTANLLLDFEGKKITLSEVRNLAYDNNQETRKKAYEVELKGYETIEAFTALALSNIKREVTYITKLRKYKTPLEHSLTVCSMQKKSLDALISAMKDYRPYFAKYFKAKAKYLGYKKSLPFYEMFAPVGKLEKTYTYQEARELVCSAYYSFSQKLGDFASKAFDNAWIDVYSQKGKVGGAFCSNLAPIKQSRILTNFTGSLSDCLTLAHELGHAYHGEIIQDNAPLNIDYPMELAETASIFCETITNNYLLKEFTKPEERLSILENSLQGDAQVIIDILSRYIFETNLLKKANGPVSSNEMKEMMLKAQKEAYLDGLDSKLLHPYMWLCKGHYYSAGFNFYNFPYAFGLLYGKGLYAQYQKDSVSFLKSYDEMLKLTTSATAEEVALSMNIDITKKDFWLSSLEVIKKDIDEVIKLFEELQNK